jgi:hypothetical protein
MSSLGIIEELLYDFLIFNSSKHDRKNNLQNMMKEESCMKFYGVAQIVI